ncbi:TPA: hypothetical protein JAM89_14500 [Legionella pneumophila]|nr:hypothetical protein [Legionella pneumophila]
MSKPPINWSSFLKKYEGSGLTQVEFCKRNKLVLSQFQYRWYGRQAVKKKAKASGVEETSSVLALFEPVMVSPVTDFVEEQDPFLQVSIHLPNHIRCDVKVNLAGDSLLTLLRQLVRTC